MEKNTTPDTPIYYIDIYVNIYDIMICENVINTNINVVNTEISTFTILHTFLVCIFPSLVFFSLYAFSVLKICHCSQLGVQLEDKHLRCSEDSTISLTT